MDEDIAEQNLSVLKQCFNKFFDIFGTRTTTNFQLIKWAKLLKIPNFYYAMTDEIKNLPNKQKTFYAIINYQNSNQPGSHHVALVNQKSGTYYFDSYGFEPQKEIITSYGSPLKTSNYQVQDFNTEICGQLCLLLIYLMHKGFSYEDIVLAFQSLFLKNE